MGNSRWERIIYFHSALSHPAPDQCPIAGQSAVTARLGAADRATGSWCSAVEGYLREVASGEINYLVRNPQGIEVWLYSKTAVIR
jgi:hypothetical protein